MKLPSSNFFIIILIISFCIMVAVSFIGHSYEKEILTKIKLEEAAKISKYIFVFLGSLFSISGMALFIRHFPRRAIKVAAIERPEYAKKLEKRLNPALLDRITLFIIMLVVLGTFYKFYEIYTGAF